MRFGLAISLIVSSALASAACVGVDSAATDAGATDVGFNPPTKTLKANMKNPSDSSWTELGDADLTNCVADVATTDTVTLNTTVTDFQVGTAVANATVAAFANIATGTVFDTKTSGPSGAISFMIPAGTKRFGLKLTGDFFPTFLLNQYIAPSSVTAGVTTEPSKVQSVSAATAGELPALIGQTRMAGTGVLAGALRDCNHHEISNYVVTVSSTSGTASPIAGSSAYYFTLLEVPAHHNQQEFSGQNGLFMAIQVPVAATSYVQAWGFPTAADLSSGSLKLISELAVPIVADTVITGSLEPTHP
ncbi:hypothetical protein BH11MYX1_BH11MYX1_43520 [soil metagenome]